MHASHISVYVSSQQGFLSTLDANIPVVNSRDVNLEGERKQEKSQKGSKVNKFIRNAKMVLTSFVAE